MKSAVITLLWIALALLPAPRGRASYFYAAAAVGGGGASYLFTENFEGAGYENGGWNEAGTVNEDYTTTILAGSHSLGVSPSSYAETALWAGAVDETWFYFMVRPHTRGDMEIFRVLDSGGDKVSAVVIDATTGIIYAYDAAFNNASTTAAMTAGTTYHCWVRYKKGTGANAETEFWFSTTDTLPTGANHCQLTNGTGTLQAARVWLRVSVATAGTTVFDKLRVDNAAIGSAPD